MPPYKSYSEKLRDPKWQKKRLEVMQRDGFCCQFCGGDEDTLNVHHKVYQKGKLPWETCNDDLATLCEPCHKQIEDLTNAIKRKLTFSVTFDVFSATNDLIDGPHFLEFLDVLTRLNKSESFLLWAYQAVFTIQTLERKIRSLENGETTK